MAKFYVLRDGKEVKVTGYEAPSKVTRLCPSCFWGDAETSEDTNGWTILTETMRCTECGETREA